MSIRTLRFMKAPVLLVAGTALVCVGAPVRAQQTSASAEVNDARVQANDAMSAVIAEFDRFLEGHPEIANQVRTDHSLINNNDFVKHHSDLKKFLHDNPNVRDFAKRDPDAFMQRVDQFDRDRDVTDRGRGVGQLRQFLDSHPEIAEQVRRNPSLLDNRNFVKNHPSLQTFLQDHPGIRDEVAQNPDAFMRRGNDFDAGARERGAMGGNLAVFDRFADSHREIANQLRKDPSLINNRDYVSDHPELRAFLQAHPEVSTAMRQDPNAFMQQENRFDNNADARDRGDVDGGRNAEQFHRFLNDHPEIGEQVRKNHSLAVNQEFVDNHPELKDFYRSNPEVRNQIREDPDGFMRQDDRFAQFDNRGDRDFDHDHLRSFRGFLDGHSDVAQDVSRDASIVKNPEYVQNHPELNNYLKANPGVRSDLMQNPQGFVKGTQQVGTGVGTGTNGVRTTGSTSVSGAAGTTGNVATPSTDPKTKH